MRVLLRIYTASECAPTQLSRGKDGVYSFPALGVKGRLNVRQEGRQGREKEEAGWKGRLKSRPRNAGQGKR